MSPSTNELGTGTKVGIAWKFLATLLWVWGFVVFLWAQSPWKLLGPLLALGWALALWPGRKLASRHPRISVALTLVLPWAYLAMLEPHNNRAWAPDVARTPEHRLEGDRLTVSNIRNSVYRSAHDFDVHWEERTYDLRKLHRLDFVLEHISVWKGIAHTLLSFGFEGGETLALSVEIRKEPGESYSPLKGILRNYELVYVAGDERDLVGLRVLHRRDPVYLFPIRLDPPRIRQLLLDMLERAQSLGQKPEFYNTLSNTCTTNLVRHMEQVYRVERVEDWRVVFPGYADSLAWELGLVDFDGTLEGARERFRARLFSVMADPALWSRAIRGGEKP